MARKSEPVNLYQVYIMGGYDKMWFPVFRLEAGNRVEAEEKARKGIKKKFSKAAQIRPYKVSCAKKIKP